MAELVLAACIHCLAQSQISFQQTALVAQDADLNRIYCDGLADRDSLSESDRRCFDPLLASVMEINRQAMRFARDALTSTEVWEDQEWEMRRMAQQPGVRQWWTQWRSNFGGNYVGVFDRVIDEAQADD